MPGGSGMSEQARVAIDARQIPGSAEEVMQRGVPSASNVTSGEMRRTPPLFGLGYLDYADSRGVTNHGGFGAFGTSKDLRSFVARTFAIELGVSSTDRCARPLDADAAPHNCVPAVSDAELNDIVTYLRLLAPPPRKPMSGESKGAQLFRAIGCAACHVPTGVTRADAPEPLRARRFTAYTDRVAHDMGARAPLVTPPLWGLNSVGPPYMHDGCGDSIVGAIACHRGEGKQAAEGFTDLSAAQQQELLFYLRSL